MANFVPLPTVDGPVFYVNPELVSSLTDAPTNPAGTFVDVQGDAPSRIVALGTPAAVAALLAAGSTGGTIVGPESFVYVEPPAPNGRGNDATGQRGNAGRPFATLDAAIAAALTGDTLSLAPGTYEPPTAQLRAALLRLTIQGSGPQNCVIDAQGLGRPCLDVGGFERELYVIKGVRFAQDDGDLCISADGTGAAAGSFFTTGALSFGECVFAGGANLFKYVGTLVLELVTDVVSALPGNETTIESCASVTVLDCVSPTRTWYVLLNNDDALAPTSGGTAQLGPVRFVGTVALGSLVLAEQGRVLCDTGSTIGAVSDSGLSIPVINPAWLPSPQSFAGTLASLDLAFPDAQNLVDLNGALCLGNVAVTGSVGATNTTRVAARGTVFQGTVTAGEAVLADLRGASFSGGPLGNIITTGSNGAVLPPPVTFPPVNAVLPTTDFVFGFRCETSSYVVDVDLDDATAAPAPTTVRSALGFSVAPAAAAGNVGAFVSYQGT